MYKFSKYINLFYYIFPIVIIISFLILTEPKTSTDTQRFIQWSSEMNLNPLSALAYLFEERSIKGVMFYFSVLYFKVSLIFEDNYSKIFVLLNLICLFL